MKYLYYYIPNYLSLEQIKKGHFVKREDLGL